MPYPLPNLQLPAIELAPRLLGCILERREAGCLRAGVIVETEAYPGGDDVASHTFGGRRTARNASMWRRGGCAYVYFTYGMHYCLNVVSGPAESGEAVLIRALEPFDGLAEIAARQPHLAWRDRCRGPARLCVALSVDRNLDGVDLQADGGPLTLRPPRLAPPTVADGPRIGIASAGAFALKPWRFWVADSPFVSRGGYPQRLAPWVREGRSNGP